MSHDFIYYNSIYYYEKCFYIQIGHPRIETDTNYFVVQFSLRDEIGSLAAALQVFDVCSNNLLQ